MLLQKSGGQLIIALERIKRLGQLWMCLVMKVKSNAVWERVKDREAWHAAAHGVAKNQTLFSDWTTTMKYTAILVQMLKPWGQSNFPMFGQATIWRWPTYSFLGPYNSYKEEKKFLLRGGSCHGQGSGKKWLFLTFCYVRFPWLPRHILLKHWIFIGKTDTEVETPILWPPDVKNSLTGKDPGAGKDWRHEEKGTTEDEMVAWCHQLDGHEFEQALGVGDGQGSLHAVVHGVAKSHNWATELNWTHLHWYNLRFVWRYERESMVERILMVSNIPTSSYRWMFSITTTPWVRARTANMVEKPSLDYGIL